MNRLGILLLGLVWSTVWARADEPPAFTEQQLTFFETKIRPVFVTRCYECHAADSKIVQGGLLVDSRQALLKGGDIGAAIVPGKAEESLLIKALRHDGAETPPKGKLSASVIKDFETWIAMGAPDPRVAKEPKTARTIDLEEGRKHWAFQPVAAVQDYYGIAGMLRSSPSTHKIPFGVWSLLNSTELPETPEQLAARQKLEAEHMEKYTSLKTERDKLETEKKAVVDELAQLEKAAKTSADTAQAATTDAEENTDGAEKATPTPEAVAEAKKASLVKRRDEIADQLNKVGAAIRHTVFFSSKLPRAFAMHDAEQPADMPTYSPSTKLAATSA